MLFLQSNQSPTSLWFDSSQSIHLGVDPMQRAWRILVAVMLIAARKLGMRLEVGHSRPSTKDIIGGADL